MTSFPKRFKYICEYIIFLLLFNFLRIFSIDKAGSIGAKLCKRFKNIIFSKKRRSYIKNNLRSIYNLNEAEENDLIDSMCDNFGRAVGELPHLLSMDIKEIQKRVDIKGLDNIKKFQETNQPFIILTGHFANWEILSSIVNKPYDKIALIYRPLNNHIINRYIIKLREKFGIKLIARGNKGMKDLIKSKREGFCIAILADHKMRRGGINVPFMGKDSLTATGPAKLALDFNYPIVPVQIIRKKQSSYFEVIIHDALKITKTDNKDNDIKNILLATNKILSSWVRQHPEQWTWFHNRWDIHTPGK